MQQPTLVPVDMAARRSRTRRLTLLLVLAAAGVYVAYIVMSVLRAKG